MPFYYYLFLSLFCGWCYKCASDLKLDTCYLKQESGTEDDSFTTYYVDGCPKGKSCEGSIYPYAYQCVKRKSLLKEGKKCITASECLSNKCENEKCTTVAEGSKCTSGSGASEWCTLGSYCDGFGEDAVCKAYAAKDASCSDAKCRPGLVCSNDKCVVQYSLENGAETNNYDACKSGHSYYTGTGNEKKCGVVKTAPTCEAGDTTKDATITFASDVTVQCKCTASMAYLDECSTLQDDLNTQEAMNAFSAEFAEQIEDILNDDDALTHYALTSDIHTFGNKKLRELYVEYYFYSKIALAAEDDKDCVRDFYITLLSSNYLYFNMLEIAFCALALLL